LRAMFSFIDRALVSQSKRSGANGKFESPLKQTPAAGATKQANHRAPNKLSLVSAKRKSKLCTTHSHFEEQTEPRRAI
jgi:hypothetical protein